MFFIGLCTSTLTLLNQDSFINRFTNIPTKALLLSFKNQDTISQNGLDYDNRSIENTCIFISTTLKKKYLCNR